MLVKLMKHELKATNRILVPLYLVLLCMSIINRFLFQLGDKKGVLVFFTGFLFISQILLIIAILATTVIFMIIRFYKNLLSDEGYLMFTLPVKSHHLITSKLIVTVFWMLVSIIAILASLCIVFATTDNMSLVINSIKESFAKLNADFGGNWVLLLIELVSLILLSMVGNILLIYVSIAAGQLFTRHKVIGSFVSYAILYSAIQLFIIILLVIFSFAYSGSINFVDILPQAIFPIGIAILLAVCIAFYAATNYIFKRKLNLD